MKIMGRLIFYSVCLVGIISCQKEIDGSLPDRVQSDSTDLAKLIVLDTTFTSGQDTLYKMEFTYDNQKRRTGENFTEIDIALGIRDIWHYRYYFSGSDTLPYRAVEKYSFSTDSIGHYLTYSNGFITKDSSVDHSPGAIANRVFYYSVFPGNRYLQKVVDYDLATGTPELVDSTIYARSVTSQNLISGLDSTWIIAGSPTLFRVNSLQLGFDNKPNPLSKLTLWYLGYYGSFDNQLYLCKGVNNLISSRYNLIFPSSFSEVGSASYSYKSNGYPSVCRSNGGNGNKIIFAYTKL